MDLNKIAKIEKAIAQKYGEIAVSNPRSFWTQEKEQAYLDELKELHQEEIKNKEYREKINKDGFLVAKKLLNRERDRTCPACFTYSFDPKDDYYMNKYDCCWKCYVHFVENREERWMDIDQRVEFLGNFYKGKENG